MTTIKFQSDKNGKKIALKWDNAAARWIRMSLTLAEMMIYTGNPHYEEAN